MKLSASLKGLMQRDGWLFAALAVTVILCLSMPLLSSGTAMTQEEQRIARVLSAMEGAGQVDLAIHRDQNDVPVSCVLVAQGADSVLVRIRLQNAAATLLGLDARQVAVYEREKEGN